MQWRGDRRMKMNRRKYFIGLAMAVFMFVFSVPVLVQAASYPASVTAKVNHTKSSQFLKKLNALRKKKGVPAVQMDQTLQTAAEQRAAELTVRYAHQRPNGQMPNSLTWKISAENIALGYSSAKDVYTAWKNSPMHYQNMLRPNMKSVGVCCLEYCGRTYWVNLFGADRANIVKPTGRKTKTFRVNIADQYLTASRIGLMGAAAMAPKEKKTLKISIRCTQQESPGTLPNSFFTFKSSNKKVLKVDKKGVMTAVKRGKAKITVQSKKYKNLKKTFQITVKDNSRLDYIDYSDD